MRRRTYLGTVGTAGTLSLAGCLGGGDDGGGDGRDGGDGGGGGYGSWFDGVGNYDGEMDLTGESTVTVDVGAVDGLSFGPAAIRISPGTTVAWEWTGRGGLHNVVARDRTFQSERYTEEGTTFEFTFEEPALHRYVCQPHESLGMKGGVRVVSE